MSQTPGNSRSDQAPAEGRPQGPGRRRVLGSVAALSGAAVAGGLLGRASASRAAASPVASSSSASSSSAASSGMGMELVLLGTAAGPVPTAGRTGIASALVVDGHIYIVDMGHGSFDQFQKSGLDIGNLDSIFITHLHSDHIADLYTMLWLRFGGISPLTHAVNIYGPGPAGALPAPSIPGAAVTTTDPRHPTPGLADLINTQIAATAYDVNIRMRDEGWPSIYDRVNLNQIVLPHVGASAPDNLTPPMQPFPVMSDHHVRVSAILVKHPPVFPSYAFRFDTAYGSVVFGGDTTVTGNMVTLARGADLLVHEAIDLKVTQMAENLSEAQIQHLKDSHTDVTKVGRVAQAAGVKTLVLSHLAPGTKLLPDAVWKANASKGFAGQVIVGNDLMRIPL